MEDYKKKYFDAIERLKQWNQEHPNGYVTEDKDKFIFPELKESEDERIRKALINCYKGDGCLCNNKYRIPYKDVISWLEKQGEKKPVIPKFKVGDIIKEKGLDETYEVIKYIDNGFAFIDKYGEIFTAYYDDDSLDYYEIVERKSVEWSEQDETGLGDALWCCEQAASIAKDENDMGNCSYAESWLKSLKDRVLPQNTWKPSDLQIKALEYYTKIGCVDKEGFFGSELVKLLEELKKL
jgi:hypothetical protein